MEGKRRRASNWGMLYHETQEGRLCGVHCLNAVLQGPFFTEVDLAEIAADLDDRERQLMLQGAPSGAAVAADMGDFLAEGQGSHNVSNHGDFSVQVMERALEVWSLRLISMYSQAAGASQFNPELETAFICHSQNHWFCIRNVNGEWYNFNSLNPVPEQLSQFYLSAFLDASRGSGWNIYAVRGIFPTECPSSSNDFGKWLSPGKARNIKSSRNQVQQEAVSDTEMEMTARHDLMVAIASSLRDVAVPGTKTEEHSQQPYQQEGMTTVQEEDDEDLKVALALSLMPFIAPLTSSQPAQEERDLKDAFSKDTTEEHDSSKSEESMKED